MKKNFFKLFLIFLIVAGAVFWVVNFIYLNKSTPKTKATSDSISVFYDQNSVTAAQSSDFTVSVKMKPSKDIVLRGYTLNFQFDKSKLEFKNVIYKLGVVSEGLGHVTADATTINQQGRLYLQGEIQTATGQAVATASDTEVAQLTFKVLSISGTTITGPGGGFYILGTDGTLQNDIVVAIENLDINGGGTIPSCISFSDDFSNTDLNTNNWTLWTNNNGTAGFGGELTLSVPAGPAEESTNESAGTTLDTWDKHDINAGDFSAEVTLKSFSPEANKNASTSRLTLAAKTNDSRQISILRASDQPGKLITELDNTVGEGGYLPETVDIGITNATPVKVKIERVGTAINLYYDLLDDEGYQLLRTISGYYDGPNRIYIGVANYAPDFPQATSKFDDFKLTCPTNTEITGNVKLNIDLKFQGISSKPIDSLNSMDVAVKYKKVGDAALTETKGIFTADNEGSWSGKVGFDINPLSTTTNYTIYIKGPQHIQKKICDIKPTESSGGTYSCSDGKINFTEGENELDFTGILQMAGDLDQNGIVDSVDIALVTNNLGKTDPETLATADLNRDGIVDTQDYSAILQTLKIRVDEL